MSIVGNEKLLLISGMATYVFYIWCLLIYNFYHRKSAIRKKEVSIKAFRTYDATSLPEHLVVKGRHVDNQFQLPMIFLATAVTHLSLGRFDSWTIIFIWSFVLSRFLHSYIHLTSNNVVLRAQAYVLGWFFIGLLWLQAIYFCL